MQQLTKYAYANARVRAMLSRLLDAQQLNRLLECADIYEVYEELRSTPYGEVFSRQGAQDLDLSEIERRLLKYDIGLYRETAQMLTRRERAFVLLLSERFEIEQLKVALRLWHRRSPLEAKEYLLLDKMCHDIPFEKVVAAQTLEEVILLLDETPFKKPLLAGRQRFKERNSLFYLEIALDVDYYQRLLEAADALSSTDRKVSHKLLGIEIDIVNINWLLRLRKYYALAMGEILDWVIPGGNTVDRDTVRSMYTSDGIGGVVETIALGPYQRLKELVDDNTHLLEQFLYEVLAHQLRRTLAGFPFTIGTFIGYLILKHHESRQLVSLFYAKQYGFKRDETASLLALSL